MLSDHASNVPHARLRILQTTDLHMCLIPFDYVSNRSGGDYSLARLAPEISARRKGDVTTLLCDTGDIFQGNPLADFAMAQVPKGETHPMVAAMNGLRYDAITLGNHDFDYGTDVLDQALAGLNFPVVLSNLQGTAPKVPVPAAILDRPMICTDGVRRPIRIGLIGLLTNETVFPVDSDLETRDSITTAADVSAKLRARGADVIVALCHFGIDGGAGDVAGQLATNTDIDVILAGHLHQVIPDKGACPDKPAKPITMPGAYGTHLGQIDLDMIWHGDAWQIADYRAQIIAVAETPERPDAAAVAVAHAAGDMHQRTRTHIATPLVRTTQRIHSYFAQVSPDDSLQVLGQCKLAMAQHHASAAGLADLPCVAAVAPYRAGGHAGPNHFIDIPAGHLTLRDVGALYPFANPFAVGVVKIGTLKRRLNKGLAVFQQLTPGKMFQPLFDAGVPAYQMLTFVGLTYSIDLAQAATAGRVGDLRYHGIPLSDMDDVVVAGTTFSLSASGVGTALKADRMLHISDRSLQAEWADHLRTQESLALTQSPGWRFEPMPGTAAQFPSGPGAQHLVDMIPDRRVTAGGLQEDGFRSYTLHF